MEHYFGNPRLRTALELPNQRLHLSGAVVLKEAGQLWTRTLVARR